eukprot:SAG31_NODE_21024_length_559_cov_1.250000_1_plen_40_part_10
MGKPRGLAMGENNPIRPHGPRRPRSRRRSGAVAIYEYLIL